MERALRIIGAGVLLAGLAASMAVWAKRDDPPVEPPPPVADTPPPPPEGEIPRERVPEYLPQETEYQRRFAYVRETFLMDRHDVSRVQRFLQADPALSLPLLREAAVKDPIAPFRTLAVRALGDLGDPQAADALKAALGDAEWSVRHNAAEAMGKLRLKEFEEELRALAQNDPHERVRKAAEEAIVRITGAD